jgi:hypothetical protein
MLVRLNTDGQFGNDGPQRGCLGIVHDIRHMPDEDDWGAQVKFFDFEDAFYWVPLKQLLWPDTSNTLTFFSSWLGVVTEDPERSSEVVCNHNCDVNVPAVMALDAKHYLDCPAWQLLLQQHQGRY